MILTDTDYFSLPQVSNSDLSWLKGKLSNSEVVFDKEAAYRFGTLLDVIITEPQRINFNKHTIDGIPSVGNEFEKALRMRDSFFNDDMCMNLLKTSTPQKIVIEDVMLDYMNMGFTLPMRCKWDFWVNQIRYGADLKSTVATSQQQFDSAIKIFEYHRQMAVYMTISNIDSVVLIGISKKNYKVFKTFIYRGDALFNEGMELFKNLAYRYYLLFG